jgi:crossover junction endodeoxyribonuclease RuvC
MNRIIGIDPGSISTGYGIIETHKDKLSYVTSGTIKTKRYSLLNLKVIYEELVKIIKRCKPQEAAVEDIFYAKNAKSAFKLGQTRGVAILAVLNCGLAVSEYPPLLVKKAVTGYGKAQKTQIKYMVEELLNVGDIHEQDQTDALAVAICHAHMK